MHQHRVFDCQRQWVLVRLFLTLTLAVALAAQVQARNIALLIGVSDYGDPVRNLEGPVNDVAALRDVLQRRWGFAPTDIRTLTDQSATKAGILAGLRELQTRSAPGDDVFIYLSGHGTSALDGTLSVPVPHGSGAFIPFGAQVKEQRVAIDQLIVGRTDLLPLLKALDDGDRRVWVVSDSCYSGNQVRSTFTEQPEQLPARVMPLLVGGNDIARRERDEARAAARAESPPYPYRNTSFLAASAEGEIARDIPKKHLLSFPTVTNKPHGAMTDALLRVLEGEVPADLNGDGVMDLNEVHRAVGDFMSQRAFGHTPQRLPAVKEDMHGLGARSVLAASGVAAKPAQQAAHPLRIRLGRGLPAELTAALRALPDTVATDTTTGDVLLHRLAGRWQLSTPGGDLLALFEPGQVQAVQEQLLQIAWAHRFRQLAQLHLRSALAMDIHPGEFGGNLRIGQSIYFSVRPDRDAWLVLVNIDAKGRISVLYPRGTHELKPLAGSQSHAIPSSAPKRMIEVGAPVGMDMQFALAFDSRPKELDGLVDVVDAAPHDRRLKLLEAMLGAYSGRFSFARSNLRVTEAKP